MSKLVNQCWALCPGFRQVIPKFWINSECVSRNSGPQFMSWNQRGRITRQLPKPKNEVWGETWQKPRPKTRAFSHRMVETRKPNKKKKNRKYFCLKGRRVGANFDSPIAARNKNGMTRLKTNTEGTAEISAPIFHASLSDLSRFQFLLDRHI